MDPLRFRRLLLVAERLSWALGLVGLVCWGAFHIEAASATRRHLERFVALQSVVMRAGLPDQTLWSSIRVNSWRKTLSEPAQFALAVLRIPGIGLEVPVLQGTADRTLDRGLGHIEDTAQPGTDGNSGIAGHRDGFFRGLKDVALGDAIELDTLRGTEVYRVERTWIVNPEDVSVLDPAPGRVLDARHLLSLLLRRLGPPALHRACRESEQPTDVFACSRRCGPLTSCRALRNGERVMTRAINRIVLAVAAVCLTAVVSEAQTTASTQTKTFEVLSVDGNQLVVRLPEGTREMTVPDDFRFMVNEKPLSVRELKVGMKGSATITTKTTMTPVTVTEVKNGTVVQRSGGTIVVRMPDNSVKRFSQSDIDKRGIKIVRDGRPADISDFREGDTLSATIITTRQPQTLTEREVRATLDPRGRRGRASCAATGPCAQLRLRERPPSRHRHRQRQRRRHRRRSDVAVDSQFMASPRTRRA